MTKKKTIRQEKVSASLCPRDASVKAPVSALNVLNLRPGRGGTLVPVGENILMHGFGSAIPLLRLHTSTQEVIATHTGTDLLYGQPQAGGNVEVEPEFFGSEPLCAVSTSSERGVVMCRHGAVELTLEADGTISAEAASRTYPPIGLIAVENSPVSTTVPARTLSRSYDGASRLSAADTAAVSSDLIDAYRRLASTAGAAGMAIQPALARYRLIDRSGHCVFTSAPVLLSLTSGSQCAGTYGPTSTDRRTLEPYTVTARTWKLEVHLPDADIKAGIARAEIYISPLFHPYVPGAAVNVSTSRAASGNTPFVYVGLPGSERSLGNTFNGHARRLLTAAVARLDSIEKRVVVINNPFSGPKRTVKADVAFECDCAAEAQTLSSALAAGLRKADPLEVKFALPHTFTARCAASDASTVMWGNLTVRPFAGYSLAGHAVSFGESALWRGVSRVRLATGGVAVHTESHISPVPKSFNPLLYYPRPDAVEMTIAVVSAGVTYSATFPLTPDESGRGAVYSAGTTPITLSAGEGVDTTGNTVAEEYPDAVAVTSVSSPLHIDCLSRLGSGAINALCARRATDQSWEFGRSRFIAGAAAGIYSMGVAAAHSALSSRRLSSLPVGKVDALCAGDGGRTYALSLSGSTAVPLIIRSDGSVSVFADGGAYQAIAYDSLRAELWLLRSDGSANVFCTKHKGGFFRRSGVGATGVRTLGDQPFALTPAGVLDLSHEQSKNVHVGINYAITPEALTPVQPLAVEVSGVGLHFDGSLRVDGADAGAGGRTYPITRATVEGALLSPLTLRTVGRAVRRLNIGFEGTVSPDFTFSHLNILYHL